MKAPLLAILSAVAFSAALPNEFVHYGSPLVGLVALVPLYAAFRISPDMATAVRSGAVFGAISTMLSNYWLANFGEFSVWTLGGPTLGYIGYNMLLATILYTLMRLPSRFRPLAFTAAWTGYELLKSIGYLGYPWGLAAYSFGDSIALMQIADITGVYGLTFLVVYANASIGELLFRETVANPGGSGVLRIASSSAVRHLATAGILFALALGYGQFRLSDLPDETNTVDAVLVQQNSDSWSGNLGSAIATLQRLSSDALEEGSHDILVWSENSLSLPYADFRSGYYENSPASKPLTEFIAELNVPLMTGSPYRPPDPDEVAWNSALLIEPGTGNIIDRYGKQQLVPFAEHIPLWNIPFVQQFFREVVGLQAIWEPGAERVLFDIPAGSGTVKTATPICFEDAFAPVIRDFTRDGANLFINLTNNAWSQTDSAQYQHFVAARFRTIESRRTLVRSTNSGLTSVVGIDGRIRDSLPMFEAAALEVEVPVYQQDSLTVYHTIGDLFAWLMLALTAVCIAWIGVREWIDDHNQPAERR